SLAVLALAALGMWRIVHSPFGLCLKTIRDNPAKAETLGIGVTRQRFYAFVVSAVYAAVGGALLGPPTGNVDPAVAYCTHSGSIVFMTLLGGFTSFFGPVVGAFVFIYLQSWVMSVVPYWRLIFGAMLAAIVILAPDGLMGFVTRRRPALADRTRSWKPSASQSSTASSARSAASASASTRASSSRSSGPTAPASRP